MQARYVAKDTRCRGETIPEGSVMFAGGADTGNGCTQLVADTITFTGDSNFAINCAGSGTKPIATAAVTLVE